MESILRPSAELFQVSNRLFPSALEGLNRDELLKRPKQANPMIWLAGHLTYCRCAILRLTGERRELPWPELFKRSSQLQEDSAYPDIGEILESWNEFAPQLSQRLSQLTAADLGKELTHRFPVQDRSLVGGISFMGYHESYHIGQMAYLRKWLGYEGLVG